MMAIDIKTTTVTRVFNEGEWGAPLTLSDLEHFLNDARKAGFGDDKRVTAGVQNTLDQKGVLYSLEMKRTETDTDYA